MEKKSNKNFSKRKWDFAYFAKLISDAMGNFWIFVIACIFIISWLLTGPIFKFSDTWQLIVNTTTTIITFLMVFLIQHTQNRDMEILNIKLDELIKIHEKASNASIDLNKLSDEELKALEEKYNQLCKKLK